MTARKLEVRFERLKRSASSTQLRARAQHHAAVVEWPSINNEFKKFWKTWASATRSLVGKPGNGGIGGREERAD